MLVFYFQKGLVAYVCVVYGPFFPDLSLHITVNLDYLKWHCYVSPESKTYRTEVAGWETNKAPAQIRKRIKANSSLLVFERWRWE